MKQCEVSEVFSMHVISSMHLIHYFQQCLLDPTQPEKIRVKVLQSSLLCNQFKTSFTLSESECESENFFWFLLPISVNTVDFIWLFFPHVSHLIGSLVQMPESGIRHRTLNFLTSHLKAMSLSRLLSLNVNAPSSDVFRLLSEGEVCCL